MFNAHALIIHLSICYFKITMDDFYRVIILTIKTGFFDKNSQQMFLNQVYFPKVIQKCFHTCFETKVHSA